VVRGVAGSLDEEEMMEGTIVERLQPHDALVAGGLYELPSTC
jgi:hypothetical protein